MSRPIYVPIADAFFESSIMQEDITVRFVMLALIRLALRPGADGVVDVDLRTFAGSINVPAADVERAVKRLMEPDPSSGCPAEDGRRIMPVNPDRPIRGWRLVNWARYKAIIHRANDAARKREERAHENKDTTDASESVQKRPCTSRNGATIRNEMIREEKKKEEDGVAAVAAPSASTGFFFDVVGKGPKTWEVPLSLLNDLKELYPNVNIEHEIIKAIKKTSGGAISKKTARGMPKRLHTWMEKEQNRAKTSGAGSSVLVGSHGKPFEHPDLKSSGSVRREVIEFEKTIEPKDRRVTTSWTPEQWKLWNETGTEPDQKEDLSEDE